MEPNFTPEHYVPAVSHIYIDAAGQPSLRGSRCSHCAEILLGDPLCCARCGSRAGLVPIQLSTRGQVYCYTIVYRSFPSVRTPFIAVTVDLEGGGTVKGVLQGLAPDLGQLHFGMPVDLVFSDSGQQDKTGHNYLAYVFTPTRQETARG